MHDHYFFDVFVFARNGVFIACAKNAPVEMQVSTGSEWGRLYTKRDNAFKSHGGRCSIDFAFSKHHYPILIKSAQYTLLGGTERVHPLQLYVRPLLPDRHRNGV